MVSAYPAADRAATIRSRRRVSSTMSIVSGVLLGPAYGKIIVAAQNGLDQAPKS